MWTLPAARPWMRLLIAWGLLTLVVTAGFRVYEASQLGLHDADGVSRITAAVSRAFLSAERSLEAAAERITHDSVLIGRAATEPGAARELFAALQRVDVEGEGLSATVYSAAAAPLAWSGRPSDLPRARTAGSPAMFVAPGPLGPRLFLIRPVMGTDASRAGGQGPGQQVRIATVVVERPLPTEPEPAVTPGETVTWTIARVPVQLRARYQGAGADRNPDSFTLDAPDGSPLLEGRVRAVDVAAARLKLRSGMWAVISLVTATCCALAAAPLLAWRARSRSRRRFIGATVLACLAVVCGRALAWLAIVPSTPGAVTGGGPALLFRTTTDFLLTAASALLLTLVLASSVARVRRAVHASRQQIGGSVPRAAAHVAAGLAAGSAMVAILAGMNGLMRTVAQSSPTDLLSFSLQPGDPAWLALETGLVLATAAGVWLAITVLLSALVPFRLQPTRRGHLAAMATWALPSLAWCAVQFAGPDRAVPVGILVPAALAIGVAAAWRRLARGYRHASQAARLFFLFAALVAPVLSWYPALALESDRAKRNGVAARLAPQALRQRDDLQVRVRQALAEIDTIAGLADLVQARPAAAPLPVPTEAAFHVWSRTGLARYRLTSAIELYGADGLLVSRFALKLPDYTSAQQVWEGAGCGWELFEEVSPFFSEERRLLYAGRSLCVETPTGPRVVGAIAIYAMLDYRDLPFIASQSPYVALARGHTELDPESTRSRNVAFVVYGWSRTPVYASGTAWTLDDRTFRRVYASRQPFWTTLSSAGRQYAVHLANDRGGIYALGYPVVSPVEHMVNAAELVVLGGVTFVALALFSWLTAMAGGYRGLRGRDLLREVRASFYRKLFLAFVAAAAIPVMTLAVVARAYLTARLLAGIEEAAARTASVAQRVVEDYAQLQERGDRRVDTVDDDILVWIARVIDQDVNVFEGSALVATSERNLYASGVLPTRTSADIYRAIVLDRQAAYVASDRVGWFDYLAASAPVKLGGREAILTVPLTLRQQAIEQEIDDLNRRILLAVLAFILAGSALGYWMAERIADPVNRLQRATARLARGDLSARVAVTSQDELRRLVEAFNQMAAELQRQQGALARTHKLEAWADMARQVAHEIKNPLTPIQLSAEHLRRVHADRGAPLAPVLDGCVDSILTQVRLLRQIAGEFSSFASSPTPRPVETTLDELLAEVVEPYRPGLAGRVTLLVDAPPGLPRLWVDRTLLGRALTNVIDNALHAMPNGGTVTIAAVSDASTVRVTVSDTGVGMDDAAVARIFEPYFSTKATGTGLGLTIAKRNVELCGGTIDVQSALARGTAVTITLPT